MSDATTGPEADARRAALLTILNGGKVTAANEEVLRDDSPPEGTTAAPPMVAPAVESAQVASTPVEPAERAPLAVAPVPAGAHWSLIVAVIWALAAVIIGLVFIFGVNAETYGGDAYTGIEAAIVTAVHAIGWVIISSGVLGLLVAGSRVTQAK